LVNDKKHVIATGYNGVPRGIPHCIDKNCAGASYPSGQGLAECGAVHGEINSLLQCHNVDDIRAIYVTCSPCPHCFKALLNTGAKELIFSEKYPGWDDLAPIWESTGRIWRMV
jgi:dCMP deaminase